ncbi:MAG: MerR family transcriptional regulator [Chloroflexi bacterium]|nr:MerR family transcriptional regulator [Chloroflexota bacterium]
MSPASAWRPAQQSYTVQQAAALTGLSEHTLRYYERIGLIKPVHRQESSGHRRYRAEDLTKLEALACLRATGMPIDQMRSYFELRSHGADAAPELQVLLSEHLKELHRRMAALQTHMKYVALKIDYWRAVEANDEASAVSIGQQAKELIRSAVLPSGSDVVIDVSSK